MRSKKRIFCSVKIALLAIVILLQSMMLCITGFAAAYTSDGSAPFWGGSSLSGSVDSESGNLHFNREELIATAKKDLLQYINQDLLKKVSDYKLTGPVDVILSFSDDSLVTAYYANRKGVSYEAYQKSGEASDLLAKMAANQNSVLATLNAKGLISDVKYHYYHILNGAFVSTTYEQLAEICQVAGVERVIPSDTYLPAVATENPVNVYDTGIFNSSDVKYTGKGTIVAILDTGCDYTHTAFTTHQVEAPLYDRDDIAAFLPNTVAYGYDNSVEPREVYYGNITKDKIAWGYDYADKDPDVMPFNNEHGTHVAGIIGGKDSVITGVAIDAQLAIMKVFSDYREGAKDGDILAALEDSIILGVDAINMSLGTSCGFSREYDKEYKNELYDRIEQAGIQLIVAASNDYSSSKGSEFGDTNKTENPDSATVGAPSTYSGALSVASINGNKDKYMFANGTNEVFFHEAFNMASKEYNFFEMLGITAENPIKALEYVTVPGYGMTINYAAINVNGKVALVRRGGDVSFEEKVQYAYEAGAVAVIIYNNVFGDIIMTVGNNVKIPVVSIGKDDGEILAAQASGILEFNYNNQAGPFMSDFSSWGPNPDLTLKPEITAHGGNIYSAVPGGGYDKLSGTSMAAPNMCGIAVLIRQYVKEKYPDLSVTEVRDLVNQLCMSTATIANNKVGNPYSPRKQGAGIADILKATSTPAYLYVDGIGKTKLELGDDPARTGRYEMVINLRNISDQPVSYRLGDLTMTESLSTSDPKYVAEMAYMLSNTANYSVENGTLSGNLVTVGANQTAKITVVITLSDADKAYLNANFANGMYVEGFLTFENTDENGIDLNAPFLAFYGDWNDAPIFDKDYYLVETEAHNDAIDDDDKIKADSYATTPLGKYYYDYIIPLGTYLYQIDKDEYTPIPATAEHAAVSYFSDAICGIAGVYSGLLRGAKEMSISIVNTATGEVVWTDTKYNCYKAHYNGVTMPYMASFDLDMVDSVNGTLFGDNNTHYQVTMTAKLDWDNTRNTSDTYTFSFYIDYEAPTVTGATFRTEYDKTLKKNRYYADITVYDNHYAMSLRPGIVYEFVDDDGLTKQTFSPFTSTAIPVYQENRGEASVVTVEITDYLDLIRNSATPQGIVFYVDDYALNANICYVPFPETERTDLQFNSLTKTMKIGETFDLTSYFKHTADDTAVTTDYLKMLDWTSSDSSVVAVNGGRIEALQSGSAVISVTGCDWISKNALGKEEQIVRQILIKVGSETVDDPNSKDNALLEKLQFTAYDTLFAFTGDIDISEIGRTGSVNFFGGDNNISCYPSEQIKLHYQLDPWNLDPARYTLKWTSSNPRVATVDENGVVTAEAEGKCRISLNITIDGKTSTLAARCSVEVKSEFIIENRQLVAYKGKGGEVIIPDDEGITTIGAFAFSHFKLDNAMEVEKEEDGSYDFDLKKTPYGNDTVTSVVIPDGVETIDKYAFYNCTKLESVTVPDSCKTINAYAFAKSTALEHINFANVKVISNNAFDGCEKLTMAKNDLSKVNFIADYAFRGCISLTEISLADLRRGGVGAFENAAQLRVAELGERARLANDMFAGTAIERITVYSDTIPDGTFAGCTNLVEVRICNPLTYLGVSAFEGCTALQTVTFEAACEKIALGAFYGCTGLTSLTLPDGDMEIGRVAFGETGLTNLTLSPDTNLVTVDFGAFDQVAGLTFTADGSNYYKVVDGILYSTDGTRLILASPAATLGDYTVPATVTEIGPGAFSSNTSLTSVTFAAGSQLHTIGAGAFAACANLASVTLPEHPVQIGEYAFYLDEALKTFTFASVSDIGNYAFAYTGFETVQLTCPQVMIGDAAFFNCFALREVAIAGGAEIGALAFVVNDTTGNNRSVLEKVTLLDSGVHIGRGAFMNCVRLTVVENMENISGALADYAFGTTALTEVNIPNVTAIGAYAFANCTNLISVSAPAAEVIGANAFNSYSESAGRALSKLQTAEIPSAKQIGANAFYGCVNLTQMALPAVETLGKEAFMFCVYLEKVTLSDKLTEIPESCFALCYSLSDINLENIVRFDTTSMCGIILPATLNLPNAEYIGTRAFMEIRDVEAQIDNINVVSVVAPKLKYLGDQAFVNCEKLTSFEAPVLEHIGSVVFAGAALEEFGISSALTEVGEQAFAGVYTLKAFYTMQNEAKVNDTVFAHVMLKDGVLYTVVPKGYVLNCYPAAKEDTEFSVAERTVRIEFYAVADSENLEKVILPESLRYIGNFAFYNCTALKTVVFRSYYAPVLEGTFTAIEITPDNVGDFPGFDMLYHYDYHFRFGHYSTDTETGERTFVREVGMPLRYCNFVGAVGSADAKGLVCILPESYTGYNTLLYSTYFTVSAEHSGVAKGQYAIAFEDAVNALPAETTHEDRINKAYKTLMETAITAYNALAGHAEEMQYVGEETFTRYFAALKAYKVSTVENLIAHLFDMFADEHSYSSVKQAVLAYEALTTEEKALVSNTERMETGVQKLSAAMGKELDFSLEFADYYKAPDNVDPPVGDDTPPAPVEPEQPGEPEKSKTWVVVLVVSLAVLVLAGVGVTVFVILKKKRVAQTTVAGTSDAADAQQTSDAANERQTPDGTEKPQNPGDNDEENRHE